MGWLDILLNLVRVSGQMYNSIEDANPKDEKLKAAKKTLKDHFKDSNNTVVVGIRTKWKKIKAEADISTNKKYEELIGFLDYVHKQAEKELDEKKSAWVTLGKSMIGTIDYKDALLQYTSQFEFIKKSLSGFHDNIVDNRLEKFADALKDTVKPEGAQVADLSTIGTILKGIQTAIMQYLGNKYAQALSLSGGADEGSIVKAFPVFAAYLRIMMSFAGISSGEKEDTVPKEYVKYFGHGFLAKATYNAVVRQPLGGSTD